MTFSRWLMAISVLLLAACSSTPNEQEPEQMAQQASATHLSPQQPGIPNTARCLNAGGSMTLTTQLDGSAIPMCQLANGKRF